MLLLLGVPGITSDLASVVYSPSRMASGSIKCFRAHSIWSRYSAIVSRLLPRIIGQPGLAPEMGHDCALGQLLPDLRQEGAAISAVLENDAIHAGRSCASASASSRTSIAWVPRAARPRRSDGQFFYCQRCETRIVQCGGHGVAFDIGEQWSMCLQRADTAAQFACLRQRDEAGAMLRQPRCGFIRRVWHIQHPGDRGARDRSSIFPLSIVMGDPCSVKAKDA